MLVFPNFSSFVKTDYEILSREYEVKKFRYKHEKSALVHFAEQLKLLFFLLANFFSSDAVYVWFADYHSFLPVLSAKIFGKKSVLVLGGYDVTYIPEFDYGSFNKPLRAFCAKYSIANASLALAVAENIAAEALGKAPNANVTVLHTGYSPEKFDCRKNAERSGVLSVLGAYSHKRLYIKGADLIAETAKLLPDVKFTLVAVDESLFNKEFGKIENIEFAPQMPQEELKKYYAAASVYAQFSLREGLPNALCEAMLCGAIPVGTNAGGIPTAIGDCGFVISERSAETAANAILNAMKSNAEKRDCARGRIAENFSLEKRRTKLLKIMKELLTK